MQDFADFWAIVIVAGFFYLCFYLSIYIDDHFSPKVSISEILARSLTRIVSFGTILVFWGILFPFTGSFSVFMFIVTATAIIPSKILRKVWHSILPGKSFHLLPFFAVLFFAVGFITIPDEWKGQSDSRYSQVSSDPSPTSTPKPTPTLSADFPLGHAATHTTKPTQRPTHTPRPTPSPTPTPYHPPEDGRGITFEEFMEGFEEYKRNGGGGHSGETWGEDNTTNEVTGDLGMIVYWTPGGKSYHFSITCPSLSRSKEIYYSTLQEAINAGKTDPCNNCAY